MGREAVVSVPDIGDYKNVEIIEVLVKTGDAVKVDDSLIALESDKAAMEVPSPLGGTVKEVKVHLGDRVSQGSPILTLVVEEGGDTPAPESIPAAGAPAAISVPSPEPPAAAAAPAPAVTEPEPVTPPAPVTSRAQPPVSTEISGEGVPPHASPSVRKFARELGANLALIRGTGSKGRILKQDVQGYVKQRLQQPERTASPGFSLPEPIEIDFAQFGPVDRKPLSRIKKLSATNLHRAWVGIPHVTHQDEADITELEAFRASLKQEAERREVKLTPLPFIMKAVIAALKAFPNFNASLAANGEELIVKQYYHLGFAVDTPDGLVVPVLRDADRKSVYEIAAELAELGVRARNRKLRNPDLQGGTFTISSLGGIGGTSFTPIVNAPEVAILGVCKAQLKPVHQNGQWVPRLMLPLSLSYDHRVIDGAEAARFAATLAQLLGDLRRVLL